MGRKNGGWVNIILGVILIVVGYFTFGSTTTQGAALIAAGIGTAASGVVQLLTPVPRGTKNKSVENEPSYSFNGAVNT
jgi:predicted phage tail protein